jgi:hypothetical protein
LGHLGPLQLGVPDGTGRPERVAGGVSGDGTPLAGVLQMLLRQRDLRRVGPSMMPKGVGVNEKAPRARGLIGLAQNTPDISGVERFTPSG